MHLLGLRFFVAFLSRHYLCLHLISLSHHKKMKIRNKCVLKASLNEKIWTVTIAILAPADMSSLGKKKN